MDRRKTATAIIGLIGGLSFLTTVGNVLLVIYSVELEHILPCFLGTILTLIWGMIFIVLLATFVMLVKHSTTDNFKALYDESPEISQV